MSVQVGQVWGGGLGSSWEGTVGEEAIGQTLGGVSERMALWLTAGADSRNQVISHHPMRHFRGDRRWGSGHSPSSYLVCDGDHGARKGRPMREGCPGCVPSPINPDRSPGSSPNEETRWREIGTRRGWKALSDIG